MIEAAGMENLLEQAVSHHRRNDFEHAISLYQRILSIRPKNGQVLHLCGLAFLQLGKPQEALPLLEQAEELQPLQAEIQHNLANACYELHSYERAQQHFATALKLQPDHPRALKGLANTLQQFGRHDQALRVYDRAIERSPDDGWLYFNRANSLEAIGQIAQALDSLLQAARLQPDEPRILQNLGNLHLQLRQYEPARQCLLRSLELQPADEAGWVNLGTLELTLARHGPAAKAFERAILLAPNNAQAHFNLSHCLLQMGDFEAGWRHYQWRWETHPLRQSPITQITLPRWSPERPCHRLLIVSEQGLGEQLLWCSLLEDAKPMASELTVQVDRRLKGLLNKAYPALEFLTLEEQIDPHQFDAFMPLGDLGLHLRPSQESFTRTAGAYLRHDEGRSQRLRQQLCPDGQALVGLSWRSANTEIGREKGMTPSTLLPLLKTPGVTWLNLQYGDVSGELQELLTQSGHRIVQCKEIDNQQDIEGLADLMGACDAVVSTSNTNVHLAGALGVETFLLLPFGKARLWYWMHGSEGRSLWYPSVRMLAQRHQEEGWGPVVQSLTAMMTQFLKTRGNP